VFQGIPESDPPAVVNNGCMMLFLLKIRLSAAKYVSFV
jgi:hypothetical protein